VRGVIYLNRRTGEEIEQPADLVVLCAYAFNNTQLLLSAGIGEPYDPSTGKGVVGKNYCHQTTSGVLMFVDDEVNPFIGTGTTPAVIDDFQGDNFDHGGLGFFGGGFIAADGERRPSDPGPLRAARHAAVGLGVEAGDRSLVQPRLPAQLPWRLLRAPLQLP
jgi:choline dehydrogenase-like flavoprotein